MSKRILAVVLSVVVSGLPALAADQSAGKITALIPSATRNAQPTQAKDSILWNDLLQTAQSGRLRAGLIDGSILSLGSNSQLRVVQHDATSQQTSLEMDYGKLRNKVVKITQPNGKFEVKTPNAVIGVIGTDFYVAYENNLTTVICYVGKVAVTPQSGANVVRSSQQVTSNQGQVTLAPGQMVVIGLKAPPGGFPPESEVMRASMQDTLVNPPVFLAAPVTHVWLPILIAAPIVGAVVAPIVLGNTPSHFIPPTVTCGAVGRIKCEK
jgi:hypothetical protein